MPVVSSLWGLGSASSLRGQSSSRATDEPRPCTPGSCQPLTRRSSTVDSFSFFFGWTLANASPTSLATYNLRLAGPYPVTAPTSPQASPPSAPWPSSKANGISNLAGGSCSLSMLCSQQLTHSGKLEFCSESFPVSSLRTLCKKHRGRASSQDSQNKCRIKRSGIRLKCLELSKRLNSQFIGPVRSRVALWPWAESGAIHMVT